MDLVGQLSEGPERLRQACRYLTDSRRDLGQAMLDAADEIERLRAEVEQLRALTEMKD